jgi:pSer/pThr/pTyr-binding forkhead associated (FHA) protein
MAPQQPVPRPQAVSQQTTQPVATLDTDPAAYRQPAPQQPAVQQQIQATAGTMPTLYLIFNGQKIPITKEQFIIGRGLKTSDLAIKDGNISRKHAAIIYHNGAYYIKDLGSVNGIEYNGKRIDSKRIDENDLFHICDYELRFTYT